mmetsp:Transcript_20746/g.79578  ORF Transcript_20746/g.79578 Transcript_20746/m.79578 type:complete len:236 (+) Transcript_20746:1659-2366(+)
MRPLRPSGATVASSRARGRTSRPPGEWARPSSKGAGARRCCSTTAATAPPSGTACSWPPSATPPGPSAPSSASRPASAGRLLRSSKAGPPGAPQQTRPRPVPTAARHRGCLRSAAPCAPRRLPLTPTASPRHPQPWSDSARPRRTLPPRPPSRGFAPLAPRAPQPRSPTDRQLSGRQHLSPEPRLRRQQRQLRPRRVAPAPPPRPPPRPLLRPRGERMREARQRLLAALRSRGTR